MQLGLENKKKATWAAVLGVIAVMVFAYEIVPMFMGSSPDPASSAQAAAPLAAVRVGSRPGAKGKKPRVENLDPTLHLALLAASEQTIYGGSGRNIFVSQPDVVIPQPGANAATDHLQKPAWTPPPAPPQQPIPLKYYGFASKPGEPKKVFLKLNDDDVFVAGEGEIVNRRYKVIHISNNSVEIQDMVGSGPPQNVPLTQGPA